MSVMALPACRDLTPIMPLFKFMATLVQCSRAKPFIKTFYVEICAVWISISHSWLLNFSFMCDSCFWYNSNEFCRILWSIVITILENNIMIVHFTVPPITANKMSGYYRIAYFQLYTILCVFCLICSWSSWATVWTRWSSSWWVGPSWLCPRITETTSSGTYTTLCLDTPLITWQRPSGTKPQPRFSSVPHLHSNI